MKTVCAWCKKELGSTPTTAPQKMISHGICDDCRFKLEYSSMGLEDFIVTLKQPILVMDGEVRVQCANEKASKMLQMGRADMTNQLAGDVIQCVYSDLPGGCGETLHCSGCTLRSSAEETYKTGKSLKKIEAYQTLKTSGGPKQKIILISTEKVKDLVLVQIDDMIDAPSVI